MKYVLLVLLSISVVACSKKLYSINEVKAMTFEQLGAANEDCSSRHEIDEMCSRIVALYSSRLNEKRRFERLKEDFEKSKNAGPANFAMPSK